MRYGALWPTGLMHIAFAAFLFLHFKDSPVAKFAAMLIAINGIARIGAGMFPAKLAVPYRDFCSARSYTAYRLVLVFLH